MRHQFLIEVEINEGALAQHDGEHNAPPNDPQWWTARDVFRAADLNLIDTHESEAEHLGQVA